MLQALFIKREGIVSKMSAKKEKKIKVLITDNIHLYPPLQGGPHRIYTLYNPLPDKFVLNYLGAASHKIKPVKARINELVIPAAKSDKINHFLVYLFGQNKKWLKGGSSYDLGLRFILKFNRRFKKNMDGLAKESDILIASHPWFFTFIKKYKDKILIYDSHNCEYELLKKKMNSFLLGKIMVFWTKMVEKEACKKSNLLIACSERDKRQLIKYYGLKGKEIHVISNPVNTQEVKPASQKEKTESKKKLGLKGKRTVLFVATNFFANNAAADFIIDELAKKMPNFTFIFVGDVKTHFERTRENLPKNVILYGKVPQEQFLIVLRATDIAINPVLYGSGICIKTLDYMAAGLPVVSTPRGIRGIHAQNNKHAVICDWKDFRKKIIILYKNNKLQSKLIDNARKLVKKEFDAKIVSRKLAIILEKAKKENEK